MGKTEDNKIDEKDLVGKQLKEAEAICAANNIVTRVRTLDGEGLIGTADLDPSRINFSVEKGIVTEAYTG